MSSYGVLLAVSNELRSLLWASIKGEGPLDFIKSDQDITFVDPAAAMELKASRISLWLYAVRADEFRRNDPPARLGDGEWRHPPLPLILSYLLTPLGPRENAENAQLLLGNMMRTLYANSITVLSTGDPVYEELKITLAPLTLGELTAIWEALRAPYQLSVAYQVRIARIDVPTIETQRRIVEKTDTWGQLP